MVIVKFMIHLQTLFQVFLKFRIYIKKIRYITLDKFQNIYFSNTDKYRIEVIYQSGTVFGQTTDPSGNPWEVGNIYGVVNYSNNVSEKFWSYDNSAAADVRMEYPGQARFDLKGDLYFYKSGLNAATNLIRIDGQTSLAYRIWGEPLQQTSAVTTGNAARDTGMSYLTYFTFDLSGNLLFVEDKILIIIKFILLIEEKIL